MAAIEQHNACLMLALIGERGPIYPGGVAIPGAISYLQRCSVSEPATMTRSLHLPRRRDRHGFETIVFGFTIAAAAVVT